MGVSVFPIAGSVAVTYTYIATAAQTTFSGADSGGVTLAYTVGAEQVYVNGTLQVRTTDYTATDGTSVVLAVAALVNDTVSVIAYDAFDVNDTYTIAQANAAFIPDAIVDVKGDLIVATSADTVSRLAVGANTYLLTADSSTATGLKWAAPAATTFPAFRACTNAQQTIAANTFTKITFGAETFDTDNCFASNRFTPTTAGYYFFHWTLDLSGISIRQMFFYKNGSDCGNIFLNATTSHTDMTNSNFIYMNGTTDYMEVYAYCNASTVVENGTVDSYFEGFGVRA